MAAEKPNSKGQAWFCTTGLPSDIVVEVDDMTFHLHKFPLMSKSKKLHQLITEQETTQTTTQQETQNHDQPQEDDNEIEEVHCHLTLQEFPGGSETFELAVKFCYGVKIDFSASNIALLRCAGEFLEMTEDYSEDNLISKTENYLSHSVLRSLRDSLRALKSCERVMPLAESLEIPQRLIEAIVDKASTTDPSLFGWPVSDEPPNVRGRRDAVNQILWNRLENNGTNSNRVRRTVARGSGSDSWLEDLTVLGLPVFIRLIFEMRCRDLNPELIESCLIHYAKKHIPGIARSSARKPHPSTSTSTSSSSSVIPAESEQRDMLETIVENLPLEKTARSSSTTRFLFGLLRTANILNASEACRSVLEKRIGFQLEDATLDDLLIPSYSYLNETLYDVDCVERILGYFLNGFQERDVVVSGDGSDRSSPALMLVGKLFDGYLSEIASDANLKPEKFYGLAILLPQQARLFDDGLYRAVDVYLKAHPWIPESEREKICGVMDCQKLTLEACTHAAQNERLPLRAVVQVLFFEQLQLRHAIAGTLLAAEAGNALALEPGRLSESRGGGDEEEEIGNEESGAEPGQEVSGALVAAPALVPAQGSVSATWRAAVRENQVLRLDMDSMRTRVYQLERECSTMKKVIEKIDKNDSGGRGGGWRGSLTRKFGCKFKTQVCDSHEPTVVEARRSARKQHQH